MLLERQVSVVLDEDVFEQLQKLATPLVDDLSSVLRRLLAASATQEKPAAPRYSSLAGGDILPIGLLLYASYKPRGTRERYNFEAVVREGGIEFAGVTYESVSGAAVAAKKALGVSETTAQTDGWEFWHYRESDTGRLVPLDRLRAARRDRVPPGGQIRSLGAWASGHSDTSVLAGEVRPQPRS